MKNQKNYVVLKILLMLLILFSFSSCYLFTSKCSTHNFGNWETVIEPTCTSEGLEHRVCSKCGKEITRVMKKVSHTYGELEVITPATCTTPGKAIYTCQVCAETKEKVLVCLPHTFEKNEDGTDKYYVNPHVCKEEIKKWRLCTVCNTKVYDYQNVKFYYGHLWDDELTIDIPATCTTNGKKSRHCKYCDQKMDEEIIPASHDYVETSKIRATCTTDGSVEYVCSVCGDRKTETLEKTGHSLSFPTTIKSATCSSEGLKSSKCYWCGEIIESPIPINPDAHSYGEEVVLDYGDCTKKKNGTSSRTCKYCNKILYSPYPYQHDFTHYLLCSKCGAEKTEGEFKYQPYNGGDCRITKYLGKDITNLRVPSEIDGLTVVAFYQYAFSGHSELEYIWLPSSILEIDRYTFSGCTSLKELYIPEKALIIGEGILSDCPSLERIAIPHLGTKYQYSSPKYSNFNNITLGKYFNTIENTELTKVSQWDFKDREYVNYYIPSSLKEVYVHGYTIVPNSLENCDMVEKLYVGGMCCTLGDHLTPQSFTTELNMKGWKGDIDFKTYYQKVIPQSIFY